MDAGSQIVIPVDWPIYLVVAGIAVTIVLVVWWGLRHR